MLIVHKLTVSDNKFIFYSFRKLVVKVVEKLLLQKNRYRGIKKLKT